MKVEFCTKLKSYLATKRAVDSRADLLPQEYLKKARAADQAYNETPAGVTGPVERKLIEIG